MPRLPLLALLLSTAAVPAWAEQADGSATGQPADDRQIVVTAQRLITSALRDVPVEQSYDPDRVASYAVSTVGEVIDEIARENGDDAPALLVNGEPVSGPEDIADYPAEAIARIEVLPRGAASRIGGAAGQRAYNVVLRDQVTSATATGSHRAATEGGWNEERGELLLTHIRGQDRANLTLRARDSGLLLESERHVVQPAASIAYAPAGNVLPYPFGTGEVDPALSALAGMLVTRAAVPAVTGKPTLASFAATANSLNGIDLGRYRSLRSAGEGYEADFAGSMRLAPWLTASLNAGLDWSRDRGLSGLPGALFLLPEAHPGSPFTRDVLLARSDDARPLTSRGKADNGNATFMLSGQFGGWNPRLTARILRQDRIYSFQRSGQIASSPIPLTADQDPFSTGIAGLIPVALDLTRTKTAAESLRTEINGPLFRLPGGPVILRAAAGVEWNRLTATSSNGGETEYSRSGTTAQAGITIPIASARQGVLPALGELDLNADIGWLDLSNRAALWNWSSELNWQLRPWIRFNAGFNRSRNPPPVEQLSSPVVSYPNIRIFDPVREETVDVTTVSGGNPGLKAETADVTRLTLSLAPLPKYNLQLQAGYIATDSRGGLGALPPTSAAVMAAFPSRYQRDADGTLVLVDSRAINFARQSQDQVRYSASFAVPLYHSPAVTAGPPPAGPRPKLDVNLAHTMLLSNRILVAPSLAEIDLLREGASGLGASRPRHLVDGSVTLSDRGTGVRLSGIWRGSSSLQAGTAAAPQRIRFSPLATFDLRLFADTSQLFPGQAWARNGRLTVAVQNLANTRQKVADAAGDTPLSYQAAYRDPVGRAVMLEVRKVF